MVTKMEEVEALRLLVQELRERILELEDQLSDAREQIVDLEIDLEVLQHGGGFGAI